MKHNDFIHWIRPNESIVGLHRHSDNTVHTSKGYCARPAYERMRKHAPDLLPPFESLPMLPSSPTPSLEEARELAEAARARRTRTPQPKEF